jgi:hypothetical protein
MTESFNSLTARRTAVAGLYHILHFLVVSSMITSVRSMAIPKDKIREKLVMKFSDSPIILSVMMDMRKARGIEREAMRDSRRPIKKKIQIYTRIMV